MFQCIHSRTRCDADLSAFMSASLRILLIGSGAREHALAWRLSLSSLVKRIFVAPGNAGTQFDTKCTNANIAADDFLKLVKFAEDNEVRPFPWCKCPPYIFVYFC